MRKLLPIAVAVTTTMASSLPAAAESSYTPTGSVIPGHYACLEFKGNRPVEFGQFTGVKFSNEFDILDSGKYVYRGSKPAPGTYTLDSASGKIRWTSGPFAPSNDGSSIDGQSANRKTDGKPVIILTFHIPRFPDSQEWCALTGR